MVTILFLVALTSFALLGAFLWVLTARHAREQRRRREHDTSSSSTSRDDRTNDR